MNTIKDAKFIKESVDFGTVVPVFKKVIWLDKKINKATLLCSALGYYEAYLNSQRVGKFIFAPGWTSYGKRLQYQEYDVTSMMEECNVLEIAVGNGMRFHKNRHENYESITCNDSALIAAVKIEYADGTEDFIPQIQHGNVQKAIFSIHLYITEKLLISPSTPTKPSPLKSLMM